MSRLLFTLLMLEVVYGYKLNFLDSFKKRTDSCGATSRLSGREKQELLQEHNARRAENAARYNAADALQMIWDDELAGRAQELTDRCTFEHNLMTDCEGSRVGQNLYYQTGSGVGMSDATSAWWNEIEYFDPRSGRCTGVCLHYTQMAWSESYKLGCGLTKCPQLANAGARDAWFLACNYSPGGNMMDMDRTLHPWKSGRPCSECDSTMKDLGLSGRHQCADKLCVMQ